MGWTTGAGVKLLIYLKVGDIKGEVKEPAHHSWIELISANPQGKGEISLRKVADSTSRQLYDICRSGRHVSLAVIDYARENGGVFKRIEISDALISSFQLGGVDATEALTFNGKMDSIHEPGIPAR